jgi:hypothetical protein
MTFTETLNTKVAINELSFPLVSHMAYSDGAENFLDRLGRPANDLVLGQKMHEFWRGLFTNFISH